MLVMRKLGGVDVVAVTEPETAPFAFAGGGATVCELSPSESKSEPAVGGFTEGTG